jgi:hypothetical protein
MRSADHLPFSQPQPLPELAEPDWSLLNTATSVGDLKKHCEQLTNNLQLAQTHIQVQNTQIEVANEQIVVLNLEVDKHNEALFQKEEKRNAPKGNKRLFPDGKG